MKFGATVLYVDHVQLVVDFYQRAFGLKLRFHDEQLGFAELDTGGPVIAIADHSLGEMLMPGAAGYHRSADGRPVGVEIGFLTNDVPAAFAKAISEGASPIAAPRRMPWGLEVAYVRAPEGTIIGFSEQPQSTGGMMTTPEPAWQFHHSVICNTPRQFAWSYWTNVANWNEPPASVHLDGPFDVGSQLTTSLPGQILHSVIRDVVTGSEAIIEMQLADATLSFHWNFESLTEEKTKITQQLVLSGPNAGVFVPQVGMLERTTPDGMKKLVAAIESSRKVE